MYKNIILLISLLIPSIAKAQLSLESYSQLVVEYNISLQQAMLNNERTQAQWQQAKKGHLPELIVGRQATFDFARSVVGRRWGWSTNAEINQNIYRGGAITATTKRAELENKISEYDILLIRREALRDAEGAYWQLSHATEYRKSIEEYVAIILSLRAVIAQRYNEGYSAKGDLLQVESRLSDAQYQLSAAEEAYEIALHYFNSLCGNDIDMGIELSESILDTATQPKRVDCDSLIWSHPEYRIAEISAEQAHEDIKIVRAKYLPAIDINIFGTMQPKLPHTKHSKIVFGGGAVINFSTPIYHFGERRDAVTVAKSTQLSSLLAIEQTKDNIRLEEQDSWTNIERTYQRIEATQRNLEIALENLEISTFAYNEGQTTILDVLQAQISWLQIFRNMLAAHYDYRIALSEYKWLAGSEQYNNH